MDHDCLASNAWFGTYPARVTESEGYTLGSHVLAHDVLLTIREASGLETTMSAPTAGTLIFVAPVQWLVWPGQVLMLIDPDDKPTAKDEPRQPMEVERVQVAPQMEVASGIGELHPADAEPIVVVAEHVATADGDADELKSPASLMPFPATGITKRKTYHLDEGEIEEVEKLAEAHGVRDQRYLIAPSRLLSVALRYFWKQPFAVREAAIDAMAGTPTDGTPAAKAPNGTHISCPTQ